MSDYGSPAPEEETTSEAEKPDAKGTPSQQDHHDAETDEDTASGGPA